MSSSFIILFLEKIGERHTDTLIVVVQPGQADS